MQTRILIPAAPMLAVLVIGAAHAADTAGMAVTGTAVTGMAALGTVTDGLLGALGVVAGGYAIRLLHRGLRYLGLAEDARVRACLEDATLAAVAYATNRARTEAEGVLIAADYLERRVPDGLRRFALAGPDLADYVTARWPRATDPRPAPADPSVVPALASVPAPATDEAVRQMSAADDIAGLSTRTQRLEACIRHLPTAGDVAALRDALARLEGGMGTVAEEQRCQGRAIERVEEYLIRGQESC